MILTLGEIRAMYERCLSDSLDYSKIAKLTTTKGKLLSPDCYIRVLRANKLTVILDRLYYEKLSEIAYEIRLGGATQIFPIYLYDFKKPPSL